MILTMMLTGCSTAVSNDKCGVLIPYTKVEESALKNDLKVMKREGTYRATRSAIADYKVTRDTIRDCMSPR